MNQDSFEKLKDDIVFHASLDRREASGWYSVYCPVCNSNRKTGGYLLDDDSIIYKCFRASCDSDCGASRGEPISKKFRGHMDLIGVSIPIDLLTINKRRSKEREDTKEDIDVNLYLPHSYKQIEVEGHHSRIEEVDNFQSRKWIKSLEKRRFPLEKIRFFTSGKYKGLPMIPFYYYGKIIGYQVITQNKYITETGDNTNLLYLPDGKVYDTMFVVEGASDALCFPNTCAVLGSKVTKQQAYILRKAKRWIFIPDRSGNSFVEQMKLYKQSVCIPKWKEKDLNDAVKNYGVFLVADMINKGTIDKYNKAKLEYDLWRKR